MNLGACDGDGYVILVNLLASWNLTYRRPLRVGPGELFILDTRIDADFERQGDAKPMAFHFSRREMRQWVPDPGVIVGNVIGAQSPWASALCSYVAGMAQLARDGTLMPRHLVPEHLGALLALAAHERSMPRPEAPARETDKFTQILQVLASRCTDHDLDVCAVAASCAVSPRTLHRVLARHGASYGELIVRCRVDRASAMLRARHLGHLTTAEIGYRAGFRDPSNFSRAIRQHLGVRPAELRG